MPISQLDNGVQQNAALVEETAASSASLSDLSQDLAQSVSKFQVEQHPESTPSELPSPDDNTVSTT